MNERIHDLNRRQLSSKKPIVEKSTARFDWDDTSLIPLLSNGMPRIYPRSVSDENKEDENNAVRLVNQLIARANDRHDYLQLESALNDAIESCDGYTHERLMELRARLLHEARSRKGLLIYGEGGIGKTYFLYELAQELSSQKRPYAIAFDQEGVKELGEIGAAVLAETFPQGFTLIIDACNELDDETFSLAFNLAKESLEIPDVNVVITTRSESPTSRISELASLMPSKLEFQGVDPYRVFSILSDSADEVIIRFQDMLFSRNPRNLQAMVTAIKKMQSGEDGLGATTQRTALIERSIKEALDKRRWNQTKDICVFLLDTKAVDFSRDDAIRILKSDADAYLADMIEQGFVESHGYGGIRYSFSSESQIRFVIARRLFNYLDKLDRCDLKEDSLIEEIATLAVDKSSYSSQYEIAQVVVDKYVTRGPRFLSKLLEQLEQHGLALDWERLLAQTIFPLNWDFDSFVGLREVDAKWAFEHFSGIPNTPFNLVHYVNSRFRENPSLVDVFFIEKWESRELEQLMRRVQNIADFVSHANRVPVQARDEWLWLSVWCSFASNIALRALSQRLMFFLCDSDADALAEVIAIWPEIHDVYARRAITTVVSHLSDDARRGETVRRFIANIRDDEDVTDSIIIANTCRASIEQLVPTDFKAKDQCRVLENCEPTVEEIRNFAHHAQWIDLMCKDYFPFDIYQMQKGLIDFRGSGRFIATPWETVKRWNGALRELLSCRSGGECRGLVAHESDFQSCFPITFEIEELDQNHMMSCMVLLTKQWLERYGGSLREMLGNFKPSFPYQSSFITPNMKPFDLAVHELLGSLAANCYTDEIVLGGTGYNVCGFCQYEELAYNEPRAINAYAPVANVIIEKAKRKLEERIVSPEGKSIEWFNDKEEALSEMLSLILPVVVGKTEWKPIALSARHHIRNGNDLNYSNELIISIAFQTARHITGSYDDRYVTIEHETYDGNVRDYGERKGSLCLQLEPPDKHCVLTERNAILLPPPSLIGHLGLFFEARDARFANESSETIIVCDGTPGNYYEEPIYNLMLMRKDAYEMLVENDLISFFAFTERYHRDLGYKNECDRHWEFSPDGMLVADYPNGGPYSEPISESCEGCYFSRRLNNVF